VLPALLKIIRPDKQGSPAVEKKMPALCIIFLSYLIKKLIFLSFIIVKICENSYFSIASLRKSKGKQTPDEFGLFYALLGKFSRGFVRPPPFYSAPF
jgi:hypothetical protein